MTKKFIPIGDLGKLTEEQRVEYYKNACDYFNIPQDLNLLEFLWLDSGDAGRKLVLYCKKGGTDILRGNRGINVTKMTKDIGDGYVMFTAEGTDKTGRTDIAVGAASTKNLSGTSLVNSILTAQTRATRRLTLQFVGGGLLDESEVMSGSVTTDLSQATTPLSQVAAQPVVVPNSEQGKDVTFSEFAKTVTDPVILAAADTLMQMEMKEIEQRMSLTGTKMNIPTAASAMQALSEVAAKQKGLFANTTPPPPDKCTSVFPPSITKIPDSPDTRHAVAEIPAEPKKRRRRKSEVSLDSQEPAFRLPTATLGETTASTPAAAITIGKTPDKVVNLPYCDTSKGFSVSTGNLKELQTTSQAALPAPAGESSSVVSAAEQETATRAHTPAVDTPSPEIIRAPVIQNLPDAAQMKAFRTRLFQYTNEILPKAQMTPTEGIGGIAIKMRLFAASMFPNTELKGLSVEQWAEYFSVLDGKVAKDGPEALVALIDKTVGAV